MTLQNGNTLIKTNLAMSYAMKGNISTAKRFFSQAIEDNPEDISALDGMAQILESEGKKLDAKLLWEKILDIEPNHSRAKIELQKNPQ